MKIAVSMLGLYCFFAINTVFGGTSPAKGLKEHLVGPCISRGIEHGDNPDTAYSFCSCTWDVVSQNLTVAEYIQIDSLSSANGDPRTLSFWGRIQPKLQLCKAKASTLVNPMASPQASRSPQKSTDERTIIGNLWCSNLTCYINGDEAPDGDIGKKESDKIYRACDVDPCMIVITEDQDGIVTVVRASRLK